MFKTREELLYLTLLYFISHELDISILPFFSMIVILPFVNLLAYMTERVRDFSDETRAELLEAVLERAEAVRDRCGKLLLVSAGRLVEL